MTENIRKVFHKTECHLYVNLTWQLVY